MVLPHNAIVQSGNQVKLQSWLLAYFPGKGEECPSLWILTLTATPGPEPPLGVTLVTPLLVKSSFLLVQVWHFQIFQKYIYFVYVFQLINTELFGEIACYLLCAFFFF